MNTHTYSHKWHTLHRHKHKLTQTHDERHIPIFQNKHTHPTHVQTEPRKPKAMTQLVQLGDFQPRTFHSIPPRTQLWQRVYFSVFDRESQRWVKAFAMGECIWPTRVLWQISLKMRVCLQYIRMLDSCSGSWSPMISSPTTQGCIIYIPPLSFMKDSFGFFD